jgi:hypothetical protein
MFRLRWTTEALTDAIALWRDEPESGRDRVRDAIEQAQQELVLQPETIGESRDGRVRIAFYLPLVFVFEVLPDSGEVMIQSVMYARRHGRD